MLEVRAQVGDGSALYIVLLGLARPWTRCLIVLDHYLHNMSTLLVHLQMYVINSHFNGKNPKPHQEMYISYIPEWCGMELLIMFLVEWTSHQDLRFQFLCIQVVDCHQYYVNFHFRINPIMKYSSNYWSTVHLHGLKYFIKLDSMTAFNH